MKNTFNVVMLPTEKAPKQNGNILKCIYDSGSDTSGYCLNDLCIGTNSYSNKVWELQHLYILSNEKIEDNDWCVFNNGEVVKFTKNGEYQKKWLKKIIASTDNLRLGNGMLKDWILPTIPQSFINTYIIAYDNENPITTIDLNVEIQVIKQGKSITDSSEKVTIIKTSPDGFVIVYDKNKAEIFSREQMIGFVKYYDSKKEEDCYRTFEEELDEYLKNK